jgi:hypothetical protein
MTKFISGIPPVTSIGAGRLVRILVDQGADVRWVGNKSAVAQKLRRREYLGTLGAAWTHFRRRLRRIEIMRDRSLLDGSEPVVLLHPAEIGIGWCIRFVRKRNGPTWIYLFDSGFFCIRSYNHLEGATCLKCVGGNWKAAELNGCKPFPVQDRHALDHQKEMFELATTGKLKFLAQSETQASLARRHFGESVEVKVVGMWTDDVEEIFLRSNTATATNEKNEFDVVLHASPVSAKGVYFAVQLASNCPTLRFLFPFSKEELATNALRIPENISFRPMSWETGLRDEIRRIPFTLVPSLWSAPVEGALVKSLLEARAVAVVAVESAFASELGADVALTLSPVPEEAAVALLSAISQKWSPKAEDREKWAARFSLKNRTLLGNINRTTKFKTV